MKPPSLLAGLVLVCPFELHCAPPESDKTQPAAPARPHLRFMSYDGDPKRPQEMSFQVSTPDIRQRMSFLKLGEIISGTKFRLTKFQFLTRKNSEGREKDVSELTIQNVDTKEAMVLVLGER